MPAPDARLERHLAGFTDDLVHAFGDLLVNVTLYGSAAGDDWIAGRSDVNTLVVVRAVSTAVLDVLGQIMPRWRRHGFAQPLVVDEEFIDQARDVFPMELDDIRHAHRVLHGVDVLADVRVDRAQLRRQCEHDARSKLLRLRALYVDVAARPKDVERLLASALITFLVILRHVVHLRGDDRPHAYAEVLAAGERLLGPLPALRRALELRQGVAHAGHADHRTEFGRYLADVERIVAAIDTIHA